MFNEMATYDFTVLNWAKKAKDMKYLWYLKTFIHIIIPRRWKREK